MSGFPEHPAWDFTLRVYGTPGVAPACLELQARHGVDVTLMLFCLWHGSVREVPLGRDLPDLMAAARDWQEHTVLPIRSARQWLKPRAEGLEAPEGTRLYKAVLGMEIECEHAELLILARQAQALCGEPAHGAGPFPATMARNLADLLEQYGIRPDAADRAALHLILAAAGGEGAQLPS